MERILRSKEMAEIILLPVRHHSPACAYHVDRTIEELRPDVILVEGPDNADSLILLLCCCCGGNNSWGGSNNGCCCCCCGGNNNCGCGNNNGCGCGCNDGCC